MVDNYEPFVVWHSDCEGTGDLIDEVAGLNFSEGAVIEETTGIIGTARNLDVGSPLTSSDHFQRSVPSGGDPWDLTAQGIKKPTFMGWYLADSASADQVYAEQTGSTEQEKAWALRCVHQQAASDIRLVLFLRDNTGAVWRGFGVPAPGLSTYPTDEWIFLGWTVSIDDDRVSVWLYTKSQGQHFRTITGLAALDVPFDYTTRGVTYIGPNIGGGSIGSSGMLGDADQITMMHGIEFVKDDVDYFWNNGAGRVFPGGYRRPNPGTPHITRSRRLRAKGIKR